MGTKDWEEEGIQRKGEGHLRGTKDVEGGWRGNWKEGRRKHQETTLSTISTQTTGRHCFAKWIILTIPEWISSLRKSSQRKCPWWSQSLQLQDWFTLFSKNREDSGHLSNCSDLVANHFLPLTCKSFSWRNKRQRNKRQRSNFVRITQNQVKQQKEMQMKEPTKGTYPLPRDRLPLT